MECSTTELPQQSLECGGLLPHHSQNRKRPSEILFVNVEIVKNGHFVPLSVGVNKAMSDKTVNPEKQDQADRHKKRLAEQLRANLMRRKEQARSRRAGEADLRNDGISAADKKADKQNDESGI